MALNTSYHDMARTDIAGPGTGTINDLEWPEIGMMTTRNIGPITWPGRGPMTWPGIGPAWPGIGPLTWSRPSVYLQITCLRTHSLRTFLPL